MNSGERVEQRIRPSMGKRLVALSTYCRLALLFEVRKLGVKAPPVWLFGSLIWGMASYWLISRYAPMGNIAELKEMWLIYSLFWAQFGVAAIMVSLVRKAKDKMYKYMFVTAIPPLLLHVAVFS